jgi:hydroxymethylglutaryl-CoA reductase (NADPH)
MGKALRDFKNASERRQFLEDDLKISLNSISQFSFTEEATSGRNIENLIGAAQIPLGVAGPLGIRNTKNETRKTFIPLATTEGALVASVSRGCKAISESSGAVVAIEEMGISRSPVFKTNGIEHSREVIKFTTENYDAIADVCQKTSNHLKLRWLDFSFAGKNLYIRFLFDTQDAMGMNMATIATTAAVKVIEAKTKAKCLSLAGNFDIDKKPAWLNFLFGRGKKVWAEVAVKKEVCQRVLKATPEEIADLVYRKCQIGSALAGSMGFNAHYANIIAAIFIATGQDPAHVVEGSLGITTAEVLENGDLYFSIYLPSLIIGMVGGGTNLPTQKEALNITGAKSVLEFAEVVASAVLAGELSLLASQAEGTLAKAHIKLGRKGRVGINQ